MSMKWLNTGCSVTLLATALTTLGCGSAVGTDAGQSALTCDPSMGACPAAIPSTTAAGAASDTPGMNGTMPPPMVAPTAMPTMTPPTPPAGAAGATNMEGGAMLEGGAMMPMEPMETPIDEPMGMPVDEPMEMPVDEPTEMPVDEPMEMIPDLAYCAPTVDWDPEWVAWEQEVLELVNEYRAQGADCGSEGSFDPAGPLEMDDNLRCAARMHSLDMYDRDFFDHTNPDGDGPGQRMDAAGYDGRAWGENIAMGQRSPSSVVDGWMDSDGHCSNIMNDRYTLLGVGFYPGDEDSFRSSNYWTQTFGG